MAGRPFVSDAGRPALDASAPGRPAGVGKFDCAGEPEGRSDDGVDGEVGTFGRVDGLDGVGRLGCERELDGDGELGRDGELDGDGKLGRDGELEGDGRLGRDGELEGVGRLGRDRELEGDGKLGRDGELEGDGGLGRDGELDGDGMPDDGVGGGCGTLGGRDDEHPASARAATAARIVNRAVMVSNRCRLPCPILAGQPEPRLKASVPNLAPARSLRRRYRIVREAVLDAHVLRGHRPAIRQRRPIAGVAGGAAHPMVHHALRL